ncbi:hypothetical protein LUW76_36820 [Actinomadura madurae]|uniref:scabin-related ADP-ribosyltransferase n=1 Tax=Actinomadura madurae TaxID=1993 RepID=UPI0020261D6C|nr:hypothetical protein [Actinomadura madurae]URM99438.1 hypothetical protein LUW76_36820 [Actinomadura madurae]
MGVDHPGNGDDGVEKPAVKDSAWHPPPDRPGSPGQPSRIESWGGVMGTVDKRDDERPPPGEEKSGESEKETVDRDTRGSEAETDEDDEPAVEGLAEEQRPAFDRSGNGGEGDPETGENSPVKKTWQLPRDQPGSPGQPSRLESRAAAMRPESDVERRDNEQPPPDDENPAVTAQEESDAEPEQKADDTDAGASGSEADGDDGRSTTGAQVEDGERQLEHARSDEQGDEDAGETDEPAEVKFNEENRPASGRPAQGAHADTAQERGGPADSLSETVESPSEDDGKEAHTEGLEARGKPRERSQEGADPQDGDPLEKYKRAVSATGQRVFRGDTRNPEDIFINGDGFRARGTSNDLKRYAELNEPSRYIGTSMTEDAAKPFTVSVQGSKRKLHGWVYEIHSSAPAINVNKALGLRYRLLLWGQAEKEMAFLDAIPREDIKCAREVRGLAYTGKVVDNPNFRGR